MNAKDNGGNTSLTLACEMGHVNVTRLLIEKGADVKAKTYSGNTPITLARREGHVYVAKLLVEKGADVNAESNSERPPRTLACSKEHDWIFSYVLEFLESERFDVEVMNFVDDNCEQFDSEEENKLVYTNIHQEFKRHIETIIESNLGASGISSEMFMDACEKGRHGCDINTVVFERMIAMDDFMIFKKIMVKRNTDLQLEAGGSPGAT